MKKNNVFALIAAIMFLMATVISAGLVIYGTIDSCITLYNIEILDPDNFNIDDEYDIAIFLQSLAANISRVVNDTSIIYPFISCLLFTIACFKKAKKVAIAGTVVLLVGNILTYLCGFIPSIYLYLMRTLIRASVQKISLSTNFFISILTFVFGILTLAFVLNLIKKSDRNTVPVKSSMILALVFVGIQLIYTFSTNVYSWIGIIPYLNSSDGTLTINYFNILREVVYNTMYTALIFACIWFGTSGKKAVEPAVTNN